MLKLPYKTLHNTLHCPFQRYCNEIIICVMSNDFIWSAQSERIEMWFLKRSPRGKETSDICIRGELDRGIEISHDFNRLRSGSARSCWTDDAGRLSVATCHGAGSLPLILATSQSFSLVEAVLFLRFPSFSTAQRRSFLLSIYEPHNQFLSTAVPSVIHGI